MGEKCYFISEASKLVGVEAHVLRYWEEQLELPIKRNEMGHRYYIEEDIRLMQSIKQIMEKGIQLRAVKMILPGLMEHREDILMELTGAVLEPLGAPEKGSGQEVAASQEESSGFGYEEEGAWRSSGQRAEEENAEKENAEGRDTKRRDTEIRDTDRKETETAESEEWENRSAEGDDRSWMDGIDGSNLTEDYLEEEEAGDSIDPIKYQENGEDDMVAVRAEAVQEVLEGGRELAADRQEVVESSREMRMLQFQEIMSNLIGQALQRNNAELAAATSEHVAERVIKEMDYQMRVRDSQEEERYKKLDETIRSLQKSRAGKRFRRGKH